MPSYATACRALAVVLSAIAVGVIVWVSAVHLLAAMKASMGRRRLADVTAIAKSIECYRSKYGALPYDRSLSEIADWLPRVAAQKSVHIVIARDGYMVEEAEPGLDARTRPAWRVINGRWALWPPDMPRDLVPRSKLITCDTQ